MSLNWRFLPQAFDAVIRVYDQAGNVIQTHKHPGQRLLGRGGSSALKRSPATESEK